MRQGDIRDQHDAHLHLITNLLAICGFNAKTIVISETGCRHDLQNADPRLMLLVPTVSG